MRSTAEQIDALESRGKALRRFSKTLFLFGISLVCLGLAAVWPDKGDGDILALVPDPLVEAWKFPAGPVFSGEMWPSHQGLRIQVGLLPIAVVLLWRGLGRLVKNRIVRWVLLVVVWPIAFIPLYYVAGMTQTVQAAWVRPALAAPLGPRDLGLSLLEKRLEVSRMAPALQGPAHFVLAQQAYQAGNAPAVARHLRGITRQWQPRDELTKTIIGVLSDYAGAHGEDGGDAAREIAGGRPYHAFRSYFTRGSTWLGLLLVVAALVVELIGIRRRRAAKSMRSLMGGAHEPIPHAPSGGSFGRRGTAV